MKLRHKLKEIWKSNSKGFYILSVLIFLGAILVNVIEQHFPLISFPLFLFGEGILTCCVFGIGLLIGGEDGN